MAKVRLLAAVAAFLACAIPAAGQQAATLPPLDEAYRDVRRLASFGLVPRGASGMAPYSRGRVAWLAAEARAALAARPELNAATRADLTVLLDRLDARFATSAPIRPALLAEVEAGGGSSPGVLIPYNIVGGVDAVLNPLWGGRGGRWYANRAGAAVAGRVDLPLTESLALSAAYRAAEGESRGSLPDRPDAVFEALGARLVVGLIALQIGRDAVWTSQGGHDGTLLGTNGPPLDMVRISTDRPLALPALRSLDVSLFVADLGPRDHFPHTKLFGAIFSAEPTPRLDVGLTLLNKQMGEGTPPVSFTERLKDLSWAWDWFRDGEEQFSDKSLAFSAARRGDALSLFGEVALNDVDLRRPRHTFLTSAGYRFGAALAGLGTEGRHELRLEGVRAGPLVYRHHQYLGGGAVDGYLQGGLPGPDSRGARLEYGYEAPGSAWRSRLSLALEQRSGDLHRPSDFDRDRLVRVLEVPDERRTRAQGRFVRPLSGGRAGLEVQGGVERVWNFGHAEGAGRWNGAGLVRVWWGF